MLRIIFIFILIYIALKLFAKYLFPTLLGNYINKKVSEMHQQQQSYQNHNRNREGDVTIDATKDGKKKYSKDTGEYIDFEEVK
jgi:hypothetical protein